MRGRGLVFPGGLPEPRRDALSVLLADGELRGGPSQLATRQPVRQRRRWLGAVYRYVYLLALAFQDSPGDAIPDSTQGSLLRKVRCMICFSPEVSEKPARPARTATSSVAWTACASTHISTRSPTFSSLHATCRLNGSAEINEVVTASAACSGRTHRRGRTESRTPCPPWSRASHTPSSEHQRPARPKCDPWNHSANSDMRPDPALLRLPFGLYLRSHRPAVAEATFPALAWPGREDLPCCQ